MKALFKIMGALAALLGLVLILSGFDNKEIAMFETIGLILFGIGLFVIGAILWLWHEPANIEDDE